MGRLGIILQDYQTTLKSRVALSGVGVHSGSPVTAHFLPADADTGIVFHLVGEAGEGREFRALVSEIGATDLCTLLATRTGSISPRSSI